MLFKNLKSGNIVAATDDTTIALMARSPIYEEMKVAVPVAPKAAEKPVKKATKGAKAAD